MLTSSTRAKILESKILPVIVFPYRFCLIIRYLFGTLKKTVLWLFRSKEFANFTYDLTPSNKEYLAWFIANVCDTSDGEIRDYFEELESNVGLKKYINDRLQQHRRGNEISREAFFGRRIGWYAIVRATKPKIVVETGTEKGLGSLVLAEALIKNKYGSLITIDIEPSSGLLIGPEYGGGN